MSSSSTMESSLRSVALLNTKGIHALVMGRKKHVSRALDSFKQALTELEQVLSSGACHHALITSAAQLEAFNSSPVSGLDALQQDNVSFYVYNRAVFFCPLSDTSSIGLTFYKAVLHFNVALAHHIKANNRQRPSPSAKPLKSALKYYKQCLRTLSQLGVTGDRPPFPGGGEAMVYLRLAALNNLAHIQTLAGDLENSQKTLSRVFKFTLAQRPFLFQQQQQQQQQATEASAPPTAIPMEDCSSPNNNNNSEPSSVIANRQSTNSMNSAFVNEVLLNVMVSGPVAGAAAA